MSELAEATTGNSAPVPPVNRWRTPALCLLLAASTVISYGSFAGFEFVNWDDNQYVRTNPHVQDGLTLESVRWALTATHAHNWHPLTWLSHMVDIELFGLEPAWHHRTNLVFHVLASLLIFLSFLRMTGATGRSAFVAALFALHPLHVESVAWVSERKDVLSGVCFAGALYLYARYAERPSLSRYLPVVAVFAAGLAAKPMVVTLPAVLLLLDVWPLGRLRLAKPFDPGSVGRLVLEKLPLVALSAASSVITVIAQREAISLGARHTLAQQLGNAVVSYLRYLAGALHPVDLSVTYSHPGAWPLGVLLGSALLLALITIATLRVCRKRPWLAVGWLWYLGMLVPVIGVVQVGEQAMADRYMYLPSIGLSLMVAWGIPALAPVGRWRALTLGLGALAVLVVCGLLTRAQVEHWRNSTALWEHARAVDPRSALAHEKLGVLAETQGRLAEALAFYRTAVEIDPERQNVQYNLGNLLMWLDQPEEALGPLHAAVRLRPDVAVSYESLGHVYRDLDEDALSLEAFRRSVELAPGVANAQYNLGVGYLVLGRASEALGPLNEAVRLRPDFALAIAGQADAHLALGDRPAARAAAERALALARAQDSPELVDRLTKLLERIDDPS